MSFSEGVALKEAQQGVADKVADKSSPVCKNCGHRMVNVGCRDGVSKLKTPTATFLFNCVSCKTFCMVIARAKIDRSASSIVAKQKVREVFDTYWWNTDQAYADNLRLADLKDRLQLLNKDRDVNACESNSASELN